MLCKLLNIDKKEIHQPRSIWSTFKNAYLRKKNLKRFWHKLDKKNLPNELIKISNLFIKIASSIIFVLLIVSTHYLLIPKNIFLLFLKLIFIIPTIMFIVNLVNLIPKNLYCPDMGK